VNEADGSLATCTVASGNGSFNYPEAITINSTATIAYIANSNSNLVAICPITSNGLFGACMIVPTLGGHFREGILALNEVFHGTTKGLQALQPRVQA
jgi:hypothetical protein